MKIIHTSDWHLGQSFYGKSRANEHKQFLAWLIEQVNKLKVDAIIVAGDIFDTGTPPSYAREMYNQFVVDLLKTRCQLVILGGNHDSVAMLNESKQIFSQLNTHLTSAASLDNFANQVVELGMVHDQTNIQNMLQVGAIVCAIPFIRPRDIIQSQAGQSSTQKVDQLQNAIAAHYQALFECAQQKQKKLAYPVPIIMTGHLTTVGASTSESVRDIYIGTLDAFPANAFPNADYIALGHIHRNQKIAKTEHIRYSGSPIALSFDELKQAKSVNLVEFTDGKLQGVELLEVPEFQPMQCIKGNLAFIQERLGEFELVTEDAKDELRTWLDIEVSSDDYLNDVQSRIEEMIKGKAVEVLLLRRARPQYRASIQQQDNETLVELSPQDVFERRLALEALSDPSELAESEHNNQSREQRLRQCFTQVLHQIEAKNAEDS